MDIIAQRELGHKFCQDNLVELCRELLEWKTIGVLRGNKLRELAFLFPFADHSAMSVAEECVKKEAMKRLIELMPTEIKDDSKEHIELLELADFIENS